MPHLISFAPYSVAKLQENLPPLAGVTMKMVATVFWLCILWLISQVMTNGNPDTIECLDLV